MQPTVTYRSAELSDMPRLLEMAEAFWNTLSGYDEEFNIDSVESVLFICIESGVTKVAGVDGKIVGFLAAMVAPFLINKYVKTATEVAWWVDKDYRKSGAGLGLVKALEKECKVMDVKYLNMVYLDQSMPEIIRGLYEAEGFTRTESTYTKVIK